MTALPLQRETFTVEPLPPFDFGMTADFATHYRGRNLWEFYENGVYRRVVDLPNGLGVASVRSVGDVDAPRLEVEVAAPYPRCRRSSHRHGGRSSGFSRPTQTSRPSTAWWRATPSSPR